MRTVPVDISIRPSCSLSPHELDEIWALTERYVDTSRAYYERKLLDLPEVSLWRARGGALVGLAGLDVYRVAWRARIRVIVFTSSVVTDERFRGRNLVLRTGLRVLLRAKLRRPLAPAYWLFDTFSYKSYLVLARNLREFWPRRDRAVPPDTLAFIHRLASDRYGPDWNRETGIVRRSGDKRLRPATAPIDGALLSDPDIRFFEAANPGHREGDMLVCLAPLTAGNLIGAIKRRWRLSARASSTRR
ncbi:MAG TPA: hypothetical protein VFU61_00600 [Steroidobacteraceae bacterium]|jgi:hypothetical protein|nr:hypothetical protein [Steroidobacteraceae bacterium]